MPIVATLLAPLLPALALRAPPTAPARSRGYDLGSPRTSRPPSRAITSPPGVRDRSRTASRGVGAEACAVRLAAALLGDRKGLRNR